MVPAQPPILWVSGALSPGVKHLGCEADQSPLSSAEVNNEWSHIPFPSQYAVVYCIIKHLLY